MQKISIIFRRTNPNMSEALSITKPFPQFHQENSMPKKCLDEALSMLCYYWYI